MSKRLVNMKHTWLGSILILYCEIRVVKAETHYWRSEKWSILWQSVTNKRHNLWQNMTQTVMICDRKQKDLDELWRSQPENANLWQNVTYSCHFMSQVLTETAQNCHSLSHKHRQLCDRKHSDSVTEVQTIWVRSPNPDWSSKRVRIMWLKWDIWVTICDRRNKTFCQTVTDRSEGRKHALLLLSG